MNADVDKADKLCQNASTSQNSHSLPQKKRKKDLLIWKWKTTVNKELSSRLLVI